MTFTAKNTFYEKIEFLQETSPSMQNNFSTSSFTTVDYSEISYVPASFANYVEYQYSFYFSKDGTSGNNVVNIILKLLYSDDGGSSWTDWGENTQVFIGSIIGNPRSRGLCTVRFFLETAASGSRSAWAGNRKLKLWGKKQSGDVRLHKLIEFRGDSGNVSSNNFYYPTVQCKSIKV